MHHAGNRSGEDEAREEKRDLACPGSLVYVRVVVFSEEREGMVDWIGGREGFSSDENPVDRGDRRAENAIEAEERE